MKLIISGVPCCGKTHFGDWLRDKCGFTHANYEPRQERGRVIKTPSLTVESPAWLATLAENVVITWGFPANPFCLGIIRSFQAGEFTPYWFAADYAVARERYVRRGGEAAAARSFDPQIVTLNAAASELDIIYREHTIQTLTSAGYMAEAGIFAALQAKT